MDETARSAGIMAISPFSSIIMAQPHPMVLATCSARCMLGRRDPPLHESISNEVAGNPDSATNHASRSALDSPPALQMTAPCAAGLNTSSFPIM